MSTTDLASAALDPNRPWIKDERELPSRMRWMSAMFDPTGKSPKLHFTRVWTLCFFLQFLILVIPGFLSFVLGLAGGDGSALTSFGAYAAPIVFIATTIISFIAHSRRLNDAGKWSGWAIFVLVPLVIGVVLTAQGIIGKSDEYSGMYDARAEFLQDPQAWRADQLEQRQARQKRAAEISELNSEIKALFSGVFYEQSGALEQGDKLAKFNALKQKASMLTESSQVGGEEGRPQRRGPDPFPASEPLPSQVDYVLKPNLSAIQNVLILMNIFIMIWSLTWVARVPNFGKTDTVT